MYSKVTIGLILLATALLSMSVWERFSIEREMAGKREAKEQELVELRQRATALESKVHDLQGERGLEEELRQRFDVAREGEEVVILTGEYSTSTSAVESTRPPSSVEITEPSLFDRIKRLFGAE